MIQLQELHVHPNVDGLYLSTCLRESGKKPSVAVQSTPNCNAHLLRMTAYTQRTKWPVLVKSARMFSEPSLYMKIIRAIF